MLWYFWLKISPARVSFIIPTSPCILQEHHSRSRQAPNRPRSLRAGRFYWMEPSCSCWCCFDMFAQKRLKQKVPRRVSLYVMSCANQSKKLTRDTKNRSLARRKYASVKYFRTVGLFWFWEISRLTFLIGHHVIQITEAWDKWKYFAGIQSIISLFRYL